MIRFSKSIVMKRVGLIATVLWIFISFSCSSDTKSKTETKSEKPTDTISAVPPAKVFDPYTMVVVHQPIPASFDLWLPVFNAHDADRKASGLTVLRLGREIGDSNKVLIRMKADDLNQAKEFSKGLIKDLHDAGRTGETRISYLHVLRDDSSFTDNRERAIVSYHVKDFDAWLKFYDEKGKATREKHGLIDRGIARGVDDPNMVYILFAVSDLRKARARLYSSELRRLLRNAGVDGRMAVTFYKVVQ